LFYDHLTVKPLDSAGEAHLNAVEANSPQPFSLNALALNRGSIIGAGKRFISCNGCSSYGANLARVDGSRDLGYWPNVTNRYLGLKLIINGETHFGWARLTVQVSEPSILAELSGYAYETTPNQAILAGKTSGAAADSGSTRTRLPHSTPRVGQPGSQPTSLGLLALGAQGIPFWRREESATAAL